MSNIKNKFVIVDGKLIGGRVVFHKELHKSPIGGGWWYYHRDQNKLILYGNSSDFGSVTEEEVRSSKLMGSFRHLKDAEIIFDKRECYDALAILCEHLGDDEGIKSVMECDYL